MLPPVVEIYIVWHPKDERGEKIAGEFVEHFKGNMFTGLILGAVEVFVRSVGWQSEEDSPRPIPCVDAPLPNNLQQAEFTVIVPIMGTEMAKAIECGSNPWKEYAEKFVHMQKTNPDRVGVFPFLLDEGANTKTVLGNLLNQYQFIAAPQPEPVKETEASLRHRDLTQGITQLLSGNEQQRLEVFISHVKQSTSGGEVSVSELTAMVREVIADTRLQHFFDASDLQPGCNWEAKLREKAATSAFLALRTDLYSSREWCQYEVSIAKKAGMPIIIMEALSFCDERGSFLMDHAPRIPVRTQNGGWSKQDIYQALNLLVNECLKRALWVHQQKLAQDSQDIQVTWWAPHAPEPLTLVQWLKKAKDSGTMPPENSVMRILHPDPPLGPSEKFILEQLFSLSCKNGKLDVTTPRIMATRGV